MVITCYGDHVVRDLWDSWVSRSKLMFISILKFFNGLIPLTDTTMMQDRRTLRIITHTQTRDMIVLVYEIHVIVEHSRFLPLSSYGTSRWTKVLLLLV